MIPTKVACFITLFSLGEAFSVSCISMTTMEKAKAMAMFPSAENVFHILSTAEVLLSMGTPVTLVVTGVPPAILTAERAMPMME
nr:hypothetical protein Iba_chr04cCG3360 [Ipomoea batatas]